jgi:AraC-like DNA-binding protein
MDISKIIMDKFCEIIINTSNWLSCLEKVPVCFACNCRFRINTRVNPYLEFYLICGSHKVEINVGNKRKIVSPGEIIILNAHLGNSGTSKSWNYWCISLDVGGVPLFRDIENKGLLLTMQTQNKSKLINCYKSIVRERWQPGMFYEIRTKIAVLKLLTTFLENAPKGAHNFNRYSTPIEKAIEKIYTEYSQPNLELSQLAAVANLPINSFGRRFKEEVGSTPMKYLTKKRITYACELIDRGHLSIKEVAFKVGLSDPLYFSRVFRALTGTSPRQYKKRK